MVESTHELQDTTNELRDQLADFQDFWRPLINYLYWEPHCYDIPICHSIRGDTRRARRYRRITETMDKLVDNLDQLDALLPQYSRRSRR